MNYKHKLLYSKIPILQIVYILFWVPFGFIISYIISKITIVVVSNIINIILKAVFPVAYDLFTISGGKETIIVIFYIFLTIVFDFILLISGLELITYFLNKRKEREIFDE